MFVSLMSGRTFHLEVVDKYSISIVKALIQCQTGFLPDQQQLIFEDKELDNNLTLQHYDIMPDTTFTMVLGRKRKREDSEDA